LPASSPRDFWLFITVLRDVQQGLEIFALGTAAFVSGPFYYLLGTNFVGVLELAPFAAFAFLFAAGAVFINLTTPARFFRVFACCLILPDEAAVRASHFNRHNEPPNKLFSTRIGTF